MLNLKYVYMYVVTLKHFEIIGTYNNNRLELRILESLHIAKIKASLSCMKSA